MGRNLTPQEKDRQASLVAQGQSPHEESAEDQRPSLVWLWVLVGIIVLVAFAAGALAGFLGGRIYERSRHPEPAVWQDTYWLIGALLIDGEGGVYLQALYPGGPAANAGLAESDRLVSIDGNLTNTAEIANSILLGHSPGDRVLVTIERNHSFEQYAVTLGMFVPFGPTTVIPSPTPLPLPTPYGTYEEAHLGVYYRMLEPTDRFAVSEGALIVTLFGSGTPAELAGLQPGDIITAVNDEPVTQTNTLGQVLNRYSPGDVINLDVSRPDGSFTVNVVLGGG